MKIRTLAAAAVSVGFLLGAAAPASAETVVRPAGATSAIIKPLGAPPGAKVSKARVTVKVGSKKVAKNKKSYKAKPGTYAVFSKITYRPATVRTVAAVEVFAECRVATRAIISDRTQLTAWGDGTGWYSGQVTVTYSGTCTDQTYSGGTLRSLTWNTSWSDDDFIMTDTLTVGADPAPFKEAELAYQIGDVAYVSGTDMTALPTYGAGYGKKVTTTFARTVVVQ